MSDSMSKTSVTVFLGVAWVTPALIAGVLGWPAIWGNGSALLDYMFPLPLIGGMLHVPSFIVLTILILASNRTAFRLTGLPAIALTISAIALSLQLDFDRINDVLFTDLQSNTPIKFGRNPLLLFVTTDAFFLCLWLLFRSVKTPAPWWLAVPVAPVIVVAWQAVSYSLAPAQFETGAAGESEIRGHELQLVYTNIEYDEQTFRDWLDTQPYQRPWRTPNAQHKAVYFVSSRQRVAYGDYTDIDSDETIGTVCMYEEDKSMIAHRGFADCFAGRPTLTDRLNEALKRQPTSFPIEFARWHARLQICEGLSLTKDRADSIEHIDHCLRMRRSFAQDLLRAKKEYGRNSREARMALATGQRVGFAEP